MMRESKPLMVGEERRDRSKDAPAIWPDSGEARLTLSNGHREHLRLPLVWCGRSCQEMRQYILRAAMSLFSLIIATQHAIAMKDIAAVSDDPLLIALLMNERVKTSECSHQRPRATAR